MDGDVKVELTARLSGTGYPGSPLQVVLSAGDYDLMSIPAEWGYGKTPPSDEEVVQRSLQNWFQAVNRLVECDSDGW